MLLPMRKKPLRHWKQPALGSWRSLSWG